MTPYLKHSGQHPQVAIHAADLLQSVGSVWQAQLARRMKRPALPPLVQGPLQVQLMLLVPQQLAALTHLARVQLPAQLVPPLRAGLGQRARQEQLLLSVPQKLAVQTPLTRAPPLRVRQVQARWQEQLLPPVQKLAVPTQVQLVPPLRARQEQLAPQVPRVLPAPPWPTAVLPHPHAAVGGGSWRVLYAARGSPHPHSHHQIAQRPVSARPRQR